MDPDNIAADSVKDRILHKVAEQLLVELKHQLYLTNLNNKDKIYESFSVDVNSPAGKINVSSSFKPVKYLNSGTKPHTLMALIGRTVPIKTPAGVLFRTVTWEQIITGKWFHSGIKGKHFIDVAIENTKKDVPRIIKEEMRRFNEETSAR